MTTPVPPHLSDEERALWETPERCVFERATVRALLTALSTEREAGERDKARLDWLGDDGPSTPYLHRSHLDYWDGWVVIDPEQNEVLSSHGKDFRAAIDAARETFPDAMNAAPSTETPHD